MGNGATPYRSGIQSPNEGIPLLSRNHDGWSRNFSYEAVTNNSNRNVSGVKHNQPNQNWGVVDISNSEVAIISRHSCKALTVESSRDNNGANILQRSWNDNAQQRWRLEQVGDNYYRIVSVDNGQCLDVAGVGKQNGVNVHLWDYVSHTNQQGGSDDSQAA